MAYFDETTQKAITVYLKREDGGLRRDVQIVNKKDYEVEGSVARTMVQRVKKAALNNNLDMADINKIIAVLCDMILSQ